MVDICSSSLCTSPGLSFLPSHICCRYGKQLFLLQRTKDLDWRSIAHGDRYRRTEGRVRPRRDRVIDEKHSFLEALNLRRNTGRGRVNVVGRNKGRGNDEPSYLSLSNVMSLALRLFRSFPRPPHFKAFSISSGTSTTSTIVEVPEPSFCYWNEFVAIPKCRC